MLKKLFLPCFICLLSFQGYSQKTLLAGLQFDFGIPMNSYSLNRNALGSRVFSNHIQGALSLQARLWNRIGIEAGISQNMQHWQMRDKAFEDRHEGFKVKLNNNNYYYSFFTNLQLYQEVSYNTFIFIEGGYFINEIGNNSLTEQKIFERATETVEANTTYHPQNTSISTGIGIQKFLGQKHMISLGLRLNTGQDKMITGSYRVHKNGNSITEDQYSSKGSFLGINVKYSFIIAHRDKTLREPKPPKEPKHNEPEPPVVTIPPPVVIPKDSIPKVIEGREITVTHKVAVTKKTITIKVWDHQKVDGDRISLNLNGRWVLINYTLQKQQKVIEVELNEGTNIFVLHALNLGKYEPNTAAIIIDDGNKENKVILESTMKTSGTIEITCTSK
jgi:hypothetical protein